MRTTLVLQDDLVETAKVYAAKQQSSLSAVVNEALRIHFKTNQGTTLKPVQIPSYSPRGAKVIDTPPEDFSRLMLDEELDAFMPDEK